MFQQSTYCIIINYIIFPKKKKKTQVNYSGVLYRFLCFFIFGLCCSSYYIGHAGTDSPSISTGKAQ